MFSLTDYHFWLSLIEILLAFFVAFYIPGRVVLGKSKFLPDRAVPIVAIVTGIVLWTWQGYVFGSLQLRWLSYLYLFVFAVLFILEGHASSLKKINWPSLRSLDPVLAVLGIVGVVTQVFPYLDFGLKTGRGMVIIAHNPSDHIWHASLTQELIARFPPNEPGMSGVLLKDYHFWFNLCTADLIRVFHLPLFQTQFIGMYALASILLAFIGYFLAREIYDNKTFLRIFFFFLFFAGDISVWIVYFLHGYIDFGVNSLINNGTKFVDSPAFGYSMIIGLTGLYLVFRYKEKIPKRYIFIIALFFSSLLEFKVYTGITLMLGLGALAFLDAARRRFSTGIVFILASILGVFIFFPNLSSSGGLFYVPFAVPRDFLTQGPLYFADWQLRWQIYLAHNNYLRLYQYGLYMSVVYFVTQFGLQLLGFFPYKKVRNILGYRRLIALYVIALSGFVLGTQFYQKVGGANIWEFFLPSGIILSLLVSLIVAVFLEGKNKYLRFTILTLIVLFIIPRWIYSITSNFRDEYLSGFHGVTNAEYASYLYLQQHVPVNVNILAINDPHTTFTSVMKAVTGRNFYFSGVGVRQQETPEIIKREEVVAEIKKGGLRQEIPTLKTNNVEYVYVAGPYSFLFHAKKQYKVVFHNKSAIIVKLL